MEKNSTNKTEGKKLPSLRAASINALRAGTTATGDIYCSQVTHMLAKSGTLLTEDTLRKLKNMNKGKDSIHITVTSKIDAQAGTQMEFIREQSDIVRKVLEEKTGYVTVKQETLQMLQKIAEEKKFDQKSLLKLSVEVSGQIESNESKTILSLINALAPADEYLQRHCINTGMLNGLFGRWLRLEKAQTDRLILIGLMHDCGKAVMPAHVLGASRRLTRVEFEVIKMHPIRSFELMSNFPDAIRLSVRAHHEKFDGTGYPDRLKGDAIPLEARITAVSDIYDAMVSQRSYKEPKSPFAIFAHIKSLAGSDLDTKLVDLFIENMPMELIGKEVVLSDSTVGVVESIDPNDLEYPKVSRTGHVFKTSKDLYPVSMY
ncbi:MAG: HD-GYP domain-containing protein [Defluviitaleaceae bacterium]|nr:HD-GYP domain-containing protein [Defluviitaleaceae bacterium]